MKKSFVSVLPALFVTGICGAQQASGFAACISEDFLHCMISQSHLQLSSKEKAATQLGSKALFLSIFIVYVVVRLIAWQPTRWPRTATSLSFVTAVAKVAPAGVARRARA